MYYDVWHTWKTAAEYGIYHLIVAYVAQIYYEIAYVRHLGVAFGKQSLHIFKQSVRLTLHVAQIQHVAMIVYTCCTRNIIVANIVYDKSCGAFESHSILMRRVEIFGSLEVCLLLFGYFGISQKVDGYTRMTRLAVATNTRRRYVMVVGGSP